MNIIDSHVHLYDEQFNGDLKEVINNAKVIGVNKFCLPATDSHSTQKMYALKKEYPNEIELMIGLHPTHVEDATYKQELLHIKNELKQNDFIAIGEIGLDLYWDKSTLKIQQEAFRTQIQWARDLDLPIVIHARNSFPEIFEILEQENHPKLRGILHCFTGTLEDAKRCIDFNLKLGIGGVVTFKNGKIDKFLNEIDLSHIVVETDAPYLAPTPNRGKRNEPKFLLNIIDKLSDIYNLSSVEIANITTQNAEEIFNLK